MTLQHQWGSVGMALALTASLSVCGAGVAQTAISTTPPHVNDLISPAPRATLNYSLDEQLKNDAAFSDTADKTKTLGFAADQSLAMDRALDHATLDLYTTATTAEGTPIPTEATQLTELIFQESIRFNNPLILRRHSNETITGTAWFRAIGPWQAGTGSVTATDNVSVILGAEGVPASFRSAGQNTFTSLIVSGPTQLFLDAGTTTIGALTIDDPTELFVDDGDTENGAATLTLSGGIAEDGDTLSATINADGTLVMGANGAFWPKERSLTVVGGGTVTTTPSTAIALTFEPPTPQSTTLAIAPIPALAVNDGAILRAADTASSLTIDALKGFGEVFFTGSVSVGALHLERGQTMTLDRLASDPVAGRTTIGEVSGEGGTVLFGLLGEGGTTGVQAVCDALAAGGFQGTVGFLAADYPVIDFAQTAVTELPCTLAVQPGQTLVIRLDQYVDADIVWPEAPDSATLRLVEAGPFGGEASLPAWPANVEMGFVSYGDNTNDYTTREDFTTTANDDGVTIDLTWQNPTLTGKVAWVDMEFDGDSRNTGWLVLNGLNGEPSTEGQDYNGMLRGDRANGFGANEILDGSGFETAWNPQSQAVDIDYNPYLSVFSIDYPEQWTMVTRIMMPEYSNTAGITIGANYVAPGIFDGSPYGVLALATGALKNDRDDNDTAGDELILWFIPNNDNVRDMVKLASVTVPCITDSYHLVTIRYDRGHVEVFLNENRLIDVMLPEGTKIGPGLQFGRLMGSADYLNQDIAAVVGNVNDKATTISDPGEVDFLRIYRGLLTDAAFQTLVRQYPYIHKEQGSTGRDWAFTLDIRYVRELTGGTEYWVDPEKKPWRRQFKGGTTVWTNDGWYAEPAEGSVVILECSEDTTLLVNTEKGGMFPSANRTYAQLITNGEGIIKDYGEITIAPCENWETTLTDDGEYRYGRLVFSGGQGDKAAQHAADEDKGASSSAAIFFTNTYLHASVADLSRDDIALKDNRHVTIYADEGLLRGVTDEQVVTKQLTGPVAGSGYFDNNTGIHTERYGQRSDYVYVDNFDPSFDTWLISDVTTDQNTDEQPNTGHPTMGTGLFAQFMKVPGILYLELNVDGVTNSGALSQQKWYRFGYNGDSEEETPTGHLPEVMVQGDFERADGLSIRLRDGDTTSTLYVDKYEDFPIFRVEAPKGDTAGTVEDLRVYPSSANGTQVAITDEIVTERRLTVYDPTAVGNTGADGLAPQAHTATVTLPGTTETITLVTGGTLIHGVETGAYVAGDTVFSYPLDGSSVARLESAKLLTFAAPQDLTMNTVAAAADATLLQRLPQESPLVQFVSGDAFHAGAMELAEGSRFTFASSEASVDGAVTLTGNATIEGTGTAARLTPIAGIAGQAGLETTPTLTLDAAEGASWKLLNSEVGNLPLTKTGAGTADIATDLPPNAGKVDVQEGTLLVPTGIPGAGEAIGQGGLNVDEGATLAPTDATVTDDAVAEIPAGQTVSGLGSIAGQLRLNKGALLDATEAFADGDALHTLTVDTLTTDGATALADIDVALPESTQSGLVFLRSNETTLNWDARARLLAKANGTRWDVFLRYRRNAEEATEGTNYLVGAAGLDVPTFPPDEEQPGEGENEWPDEDGDGSDTGDELGDQIQEGGNAAGGAEGYTMATTKRLTATDIAHVYDCFGSVWTYARRNNDRASEDYATIDLLMAYEFGISRMAFSQDNAYIVIEATLRNALAVCPYFDPTLLQGADKLKPVFLPGVTVAIVGPKGVIADAKEIDADEAERNGFTPNVSANETSRWFLVPYNDTNFPEGTATNLNVRAIPPAEQTATPEN